MRRRLPAALLVALVGLLLASAGASAPQGLRINVSSPVEATSTAGASVTYSVSAHDMGNPINATCSPGGGSGSGDFDVTTTMPIGTTTIHCDATLEDLSTISEEKSVTVQDTTAPSFSSVSQVTASTTNPAGTTVNYDPPTATDLGESIAVTCSPAPGSLFLIGTTQVDCSADDGRGNTGHALFNVVVTLDDDQAPTFTTVPDSSTTEATGPGGAAVGWTIAATDNTDPTPTINCDHASGSTFPLGTTPVTCTASDDAGNIATAPTFNVTVVDTTPPTLNLPGNQNVETENPGGTTVTYSASATDVVAGTISASCNPASGTLFAVTTTSVNCSASDGHNPPTTGSFTVTVTLVDHTAPTFSGVPADLQVEANGPGGSLVNFPTPTAADGLDGPIAGVSCAPGSGSLFPLGTTTVTCSATDAHSNVGSASFHVIVRDTTPPNLVVPAPRSVYATSPLGISDSESGVAGFVSAANADDIVDPHPVVGSDIHSVLPIGVTVINFFARDFSGNGTTRGVAITVLPQPPAGTPPLPIPPTAKPPPNVGNLRVVPGNGTIRLVWAAVVGAVKYYVYRSESGQRTLSAEGHGELVYSGPARSFTDRGLKNGVEYRYVVVSEDAAGNRSAGVAIVAVPHRDLLRSPKNGARLKKAPKLVWTADAEADYYNAQLLLNGVKVLSVWPIRPQFQLKKTWKFQGRKYTLRPGVYTWYVWPGYGARAAVDYGELLGFRTFRIVR